MFACTYICRWRPQMATPHLQRQHWRKSSQWFGLDRQHAALAVVDRHVWEVFHRWGVGVHQLHHM